MTRCSYVPKSIDGSSQSPKTSLFTVMGSTICAVKEAALYPFSISEEALIILLLVKNILSLWTLRGLYKHVGKPRYLKVGNFILENRFGKKQMNFISRGADYSRITPMGRHPRLHECQVLSIIRAPRYLFPAGRRLDFPTSNCL